MCFLVFLVLLNLLHSEANTTDISGHLFTHSLGVSSGLNKGSQFCGQIHLYEGSTMVSRDEVTVPYCLFVSLCFTWQQYLIAYKYLNTHSNLRFLNMNHEKNKLYQTAALRPLLATPMFSSAEAFLSHKH